jgi:hypothetical protein
MGFGKLFNKIKSGTNKFFSKGGEGSKILGKVSSGFSQVGNIADQVASSPIVQSGANAVGAYLGDPSLGSQIAKGANLLSNVTHQGAQLTNQSNYAGQNLNQIKNNVLERAQNIQKTVNAGPQFA